jgi:CRISPR-associated protein Csd1
MGAAMSWMEKLYETYNRCAGIDNLQSNVPLAPPFHGIQQAHIEVVLDEDGNFRRARVIERENTVIPVTEKSATARTSAVVPHPLCDYVKYCAGDYKEAGEKTNKHAEEYLDQLRKWCDSIHAHPKAIAVLKYVQKKSLLRDLVGEGVLPVAGDGELLDRWGAGKEKAPLFRQLTPAKGIYKPQNALIRWIVESRSDLVSEVWKDRSLQRAWNDYCNAEAAATGLCMVTGAQQVLATKHPKGVRGGRDGAKLISWKKEDESDFIYLGRFLEASHVLGVGREVTQKAHSALRWIIQRQGYRNGDQVFVAWAVAGKPVPDPFQDSRKLFLAADEAALEDTTGDEEPSQPNVGDVGQAFAWRLKKAIAGYRAALGSMDGIVVMGLDSATPGRMAITFYRELTGSEFLDRVQAWHEACAWHQDYGKDPESKKALRFIGAPSPTDIAEAAFGPPRDKKQKLHKATVERPLPCIIDGRPLPRDLMESAVRRTCNRSAFEKDKNREERGWERNLGIACALFRGFFRERGYDMTLETERISRDYLYGRLLAIGERIERVALNVADEKRDTNAARLMQRFADRPASTWRSIELALAPYKTRLRARRPGFLHKMEERLDEVISAFTQEDFVDDRKLSGEFLLGYHCERRSLRPGDAGTLEANGETADNRTVEGGIS